MSHRFFIDQTPQGDRVILSGDQAHHAAQVMRFQVNDELILFDGTGAEYECAITRIDKRNVELDILQRRDVERTLATEITLAVALPKGDRQKFLVEKLVELGVTRLIPLKASRTVAVANDKAIGRLKKQVIEASKQCERNRLMEVLPAKTLPEFADWAEANLNNADLFFGAPESELTVSSVAAQKLSSVAIAIGPEGGFSQEENELFRSREIRPLKIGPTILRVETAALAVAAVFGIGCE